MERSSSVANNRNRNQLVAFFTETFSFWNFPVSSERGIYASPGATSHLGQNKRQMKKATKPATKKAAKDLKVKTDVSKVIAAPAEVKDEKTKAHKPTKSKRDESVYKFENVEYGKGRLVHAIVASWIKAHPKADIKKLEETFPHNLIHRYGVFTTLADAKERSAERKRYFIGESEILEVGGKKICVCNQITAEIVNKFIEHCATLGLKVK